MPGFGCSKDVVSCVLLAWISGKESEYMETLTDDDVGQKCVEMLNLFLGKVRKIPKLKKVTR